MKAFDEFTKVADICSHFLKADDWKEARNELQLIDEQVLTRFKTEIENKEPEKFNKFKTIWEILTADGATRKWKGRSIADHLYEYRQWLNINYNNLIKPRLTPMPDHPRITQLRSKHIHLMQHKTTTRLRKITEGRRGYALRMYYEMEKDTAALQAKMALKYILHPEKCVYAGPAIPTEILRAMDLTPYPMTIQSSVRVSDQRGSIEFLDACTEAGIPQDTCSYPRMQVGAALLDEYIDGIPCAATSNITCDPYQVANALCEKKLGVPFFYFDHAYRHKSKEGHLSYVKQMREFIKFLEKHTGAKFDIDRLKEVCECSNRQQEMSIECHELNAGPLPPIPDDMLLLSALLTFSGPYAGIPEGEVVLRRQLELARKAVAAGEGYVPNQKYRTILWNPPPGSYVNFIPWIGNCWGVAICDDMEAFGYFDYIDTSSEEAMFETLARKTMSYVMSRHTRGDAANYFEEGLFKMCDMVKPDFIIQADHVGCHNVNALTGVMDEECERRGYKLLRLYQDLADVRVVNHQGVRKQVNEYMTNIMNATPVDPSLLVFDDDNEW
jgi:hypothetical protein